MTKSTTVPFPIKLTTYECEELNVFSELNGWQTDYHQHGRGAFESSFKLYRSDELSVTDQHCNLEMAASGTPPAGQVPLFLVLNRGDRGIFNGRELQPNEVFVMPPGCEGTYRTPADLRLINLQIPEARLCAALRTMSDQEFEQLVPGSRRLTLPKETISRLAMIAHHVLEDSVDHSIKVDSDVRQHEAEEFLVTTLVTGLTEHLDLRPERGRKNHVEYVKSARDYIESHLEAPLGLETLAREVGVTLRTLEAAFREVFDTTPLRYLKTRRLHAARRRLRAGRDPELKVTAVALGCGFQHLSYFAQDYRALFGEYPSETLENSRGLAPSSARVGK